MLRIEAIPAFSDNYIWCIHDGRDAWAVDPGSAAPVQDYLAATELQLRGILLTHHHSDHVGGVAELARKQALDVIYGPRNPAIAGITAALGEGDRIEILGQTFDVLEVPGHTLDHIAYVGRAMNPPVLFCGDTLFAAGCGRLFEGSAAQMWKSLDKLKALPPATAVYCAHEYTQANLRFALAVEPDNLATQQRLQAVSAQRNRGQPTLPSTIALELATNPFLRTQAGTVNTAARARGATDGADVQIFAALRAWKDDF